MNFRWKDKFDERLQKGNIRSLSCVSELLDFHSNDYLGFSKINFPYDTNQFSSTGSRLISGTSAIALETEKYLAKTFSVEAALIFNSGYDANLGLFSSVLQKGDIVLYDELIHASIRDGIRLSFANAFSFQHNSLEHLKKRLESCADETVYIAIESYYSMDGDFAPLKEILDLAVKYNAHVIVDEAHAGGIMGKNGLGCSFEFSQHPALFARVFTFGKAFGAHGAMVLGSEELINYLVNFARSFIYTTALPPEAYHRIGETVKKAVKSDEIRNQLTQNIACWNSYFNGNNGPIQIVQGDSSHLLSIVEQGKKDGYALKAVLSPTVSKEKERLRICINADQTVAQIEEFAKWLKKQMNK